MKMYTRFLFMVLIVVVFLLVIFSHIDSHVGTGPLGIYDDFPRAEPIDIELARDSEPENTQTSPTSETGKTKDKHAGKDKHDKHKAEKSEPKQEVEKAHDASKDTSGKGRQSDNGKSSGKNSPTDASTKNDENSQEAKTKETTEANRLVLVSKSPSAALKNLKYPDWWTKAWSQSATSGQGQIFVGDKPLFPPCTDAATKPSNKIFHMEEPRNYISQTKNPCWYDRPEQKRGFRCLPYFYIAGVAKCGTTDMNYRLMLHPDVLKGTMKEYHWWDRYRFEALRPGSNKRGGRSSGPVSFSLYTRMIVGKKDVVQLTDDLKTRGYSDKIFGDASPSYLWDMHHWDQLDGNQGCSEPRVVIAQHIHHVYPDAKMILIFRHPTPRLYSRFLSRIPRTSYMKGATADSFHRMVTKAVRLYRECFARWSVRHCAYNQTLRGEAVVRLTEGMYSVYMADWLRIFPKDKLLLLRYEDYAADMPKELTKIFDFLGLASVNGTKYAKEIFTASVQNQGAMYTKLGHMKPETEAILNEFYDPFINKLAEILNDERFLWRDAAKKPAETQDRTETQKEDKGHVAASRKTKDGKRPANPASSATEKTSSSKKPSGKISSKTKENTETVPTMTVETETELPLITVAKAPGKPIKKPQYPAWWVKGWSKSATSGLESVFVGDKPLYPPCSSSLTAKRGVGMVEPGVLIPNTKNPCWYDDEEASGDLRCVPYFYVAGVPNCGTVELHRRLKFHPNVSFGSLKEYHWWDRTRFGDGADDKSPLNGRISFKQYTELIPGKEGLKTLLADLTSGGNSIRVFGDVSPSYFVDVNHWPLLDGNQGCEEPRVVIGQHIRHVFPGAKIIISVRHPTPRLYSSYLYSLPRSRGPKRFTSFMFHKLVTKAVRSYQECFERWSVRHCAYNVTLYQKERVRLVEGMYPVFLADWLRIFPRYQILVVRYRDLVRDTGNEMKRIVQFLDLPPLNRTIMAAILEQSRINTKETMLYKEFGPMLPETVDMLNDFYEPFVDKFAEILNDEKFMWRDTDHL